MIINVIHCGLPKGEATSEPTEECGVYNIYISRNLSEEQLREKIKHELSHIVNDDFYIDDHVNLVEQMVRRRVLSDDELERINFYHHYIEPSEEKGFLR
ncbi:MULTISPECIES: ImmA/IrrE family metallo-endopeptidase [Bacillota]|uniref:ImmA/IrrE family metallo-endopeptidase n=1 Tax=Bacillota TaxID=1239 RepID=UPI0023F0F56B|nr:MULTISPECIES: ImmA/IrrE family metallo-endopeptidase [Bacillota]MCI6408024.1 ImmA/IrrE family metallo-endopeptidase [Veillonella caviae]MDY6231017.1 hypothetical protein [Peptostreptococcus porci]